MSERPLKLIYLLLMIVLMSGCSSAQESMYDAAISAERLISGLNEAYITIRGQKTAYLERPGDGETILLLHGFGADKDNWVRFVRYLPRQYRVIAFDLPGHGGSSRDDVKTYTIDFITEGFAEAADALDLKRFHLAGNSMGGWVSMLYTERNPERVITLGLFDTAGTASPEPSDLQAALDRGDNILVPETQEAFLTLMDYGFFNKPFIPWPVKSVLARRAVEDAPFKKKMWNDINLDRKDIAPALPDLNLPTLILWGADDRIVHVSAVRTYERYLPRSETVIMKDCGHVPMLERPKETANYYVNFLDKHKVQAVP
ncbi:MAG TPA: alpha/beta hydrolase [Deltaproteobacteria bacterium]|nr:alpha/beta hydrolase [Deltaproteobacteria bacterium]HPR55328.1 alpha/beta hydrolase [Deltaproteobacteria bacterium]HXK47454.1 alpha/beta hydrolase [Deltaproteobacteria bacterium]